MAVLVEAISVIVRRTAVEQRFPGGWAAFVRYVPHRVFCYDDELACVGFMSPVDVRAYVSELNAKGLLFEEHGEAVDIAVVDQLHGPTVLASWLEVSKVEVGGMKLCLCWLKGQTPKHFVAPEGWKYEGSLSQNADFVPAAAFGERLKFLRRQNGVEVYLDQYTGKEKYIGRPTIEGDSEAATFTRIDALIREVLEIGDRRGSRTAIPQMRRLEFELLPRVASIVHGPGREMSLAHFAHGLVLRKLRRLAEAVEAFRIANILEPRNVHTLREIVGCLGEQNRAEEALPYAREAVEVALEDEGVWGNLAMCLIQCGLREEARQAIDFALRLNPRDQINRQIKRAHFKS